MQNDHPIALERAEMSLVAIIVNPALVHSFNTRRLPTAIRSLALLLRQQLQCRASSFVQFLAIHSARRML
jgi:hypothetical protein